MANKELGARLQKLRKLKGLTQQDAAELLGLKNKTTLASWEYGKSEPDIATFLKLGQIYGIDDFKEEFFSWLNNKEFFLSSLERELIETYRVLDEHGQKTVDMILNNEYSRCTQADSQTAQPQAKKGVAAAIIDDNEGEDFEDMVYSRNIAYSDIIQHSEHMLRIAEDPEDDYDCDEIYTSDEDAEDVRY